jgi:hypothetical protein
MAVANIDPGYIRTSALAGGSEFDQLQAACTKHHKDESLFWSGQPVIVSHCKPWNRILSAFEFQVTFMPITSR